MMVSPWSDRGGSRAGRLQLLFLQRLPAPWKPLAADIVSPPGCRPAVRPPHSDSSGGNDRLSLSGKSGLIILAPRRGVVVISLNLPGLSQQFVLSFTVFQNKRWDCPWSWTNRTHESVCRTFTSLLECVDENKQHLSERDQLFQSSSQSVKFSVGFIMLKCEVEILS